MARWPVAVFFAALATFSPSCGQTCRTNGGRNPGKACRFPFKFDGTTYTGCPVDLKDPSKRWCSTKTDAENNHITGAGEFGFCAPDCPKTDTGCVTKSGPAGPGKPCVFPFKFKNVTYLGCPPDLDDENETWCSTSVDKNGVHISGKNAFGLCSENECPLHKTTVATSKNAPSRCPKRGHKCRPVVVCSNQFPSNSLQRQTCRLDDGTIGHCCGDITRITSNGILSTDAESGLRTGLDFSTLSNRVVLRAADLGVEFADNVTSLNIRTIDSKTSATFRHWQNQRQSPGIQKIGHDALAFTQAAFSLRSQFDINEINDVEFEEANIDSTPLQRLCPRTPRCNPQARYRTIDGSCNNLRKPKYGMSFTPLQRLLRNAYADGLMLPRVSSTGQPLPSTRFVSTTARGNQLNADPKFTAMLVAFGQYLDHDLDHVPITQIDGEPVECCTEEGKFEDPEELSPEQKAVCFPIEVPRNDSRLGGQQKCINFVRSVAAPSLICQPGPLQQVNQITHWLDASNVYGSLPDVARSLRSFRSGRLKSVLGSDGRDLLPIDPSTSCAGPSGACGLAGDLRPNEQPTLGTMHVLFLREHNRIAKVLGQINPKWNDERLFQETRRILTAEWQHIIYNEWLPIVLGSKFLKTFGLQPLTRGRSDFYRSDFDPRVTNEFATAAFRIGHTLIPSVITTFSAISRRATGSLDLQDVFSDGDVIRQPSMTDEIIRGLTIQPTESVDNNFVEDVTDRLFDDGEFSLDLIALNMQRGRDHGIPGYVRYREICGLGRARSFQDLSSNIPQDRIQLLERAYDHVDDIDLFIGMTQEVPDRSGDAFVGKTFLCLIGDVFARMRFGDRFFYDLRGQPGSFTEDQVDQIRRASLARLICDNTGISEIQPLAMRQEDGETNPLTQCESRLFLFGIPKVDLAVFKE